MIYVFKGVVAIVALIHIYILVMEMFLWVKKGPSVFKKFPKEMFENTVDLGKNMGLYNGFIAGGLILSLALGNTFTSFILSGYFLLCVAIAGIYAGVKVDKGIFFKQGLSAIVALGLELLLILK